MVSQANNFNYIELHFQSEGVLGRVEKQCRGFDVIMELVIKGNLTFFEHPAKHLPNQLFSYLESFTNTLTLLYLQDNSGLISV